MKTFITLLLISCTIFSACKKAVTCKGNCVDIRIAGRMYDAVSNQGFSNQNIEVHWNKNGYCIFCASKKVSSGKTNNSGYFDFIIRIDTSLFNENHLSVSVNNPQGYLGSERPNTSKSYYDFLPGGFSNIEFPFYPEAELTLRLHRNLTDSFRYFSVEHSFIPNSTIYSFSISSPSQAQDTVRKTVTTAGIKTIVRWRKTFSPGIYTEQSDSIVATKVGPNVLDIIY